MDYNSDTSNMAEPKIDNQPPKLKRNPSGDLDPSSFGDVLEWFLNFDERTARMRHPHSDELFQWKQQEDKVSGVATYPFTNAEERFAVGAFQALAENDSEDKLRIWIESLLETIQESHKTKTEIGEAYKLDADLDASAVAKAQYLTTAVEKKIYLTSCWLETLCTAETRVLGWIFQDLYGKPFA
jgi:hypothetical protein